MLKVSWKVSSYYYLFGKEGQMSGYLDSLLAPSLNCLARLNTDDLKLPRLGSPECRAGTILTSTATVISFNSQSELPGLEWRDRK